MAKRETDIDVGDELTLSVTVVSVDDHHDHHPTVTTAANQTVIPL